MVVSNMKLEYAKDNLTQQPYRHYLKRYQETSPRVISESSGLVFHEKEQAFLIRFMGVLYQVTHPGFQIRHQEQGNGIYMLEENNKEANVLWQNNIRSPCTARWGRAPAC